MSDIAVYEIYMYNGSDYKYLDKTSNTSYQISNLKAATGYKFKVRAYITINSKNYYGSYMELQAGTLPNKVTGLTSTEQTINSIKIEWDKLEEATGYAVYVYSQYSQSFKLYKKTTNTSMIISDLDIAKFYKIYVKSYVTIEGKTYYSDESNTISQKTKSTENIKAGIDVSKYQTDINWKKVKDSGVEFAIIRIGYRGYGDKGTICEDPYFKDNIKEAMAEGIEVGVYFFSYAIDEKEAEEEAKWVIDTLTFGKTLKLKLQ